MIVVPDGASCDGIVPDGASCNGNSARWCQLLRELCLMVVVVTRIVRYGGRCDGNSDRWWWW